MTDDDKQRDEQRAALFADLRHLFGELGAHLIIEDIGLGRHPDAGLPVGFTVDGDRNNVTIAVTVRPRTGLHQQIRSIAASDLGGRLFIELTPTAARHTAGSLVVRADEVDPDTAGLLSVLAEGAQEGIVRGLVHSALPDSLPRHQVARTAEHIAELVIALARATVARG